MKHGLQPGIRTGFALQISIAGVAFGLPHAAWADAEIRPNMVVTATGGWSSNPFAEIGSDLGSAFVQIDARPTINRVTENSVISLSGVLEYQHYFKDYADSSDYGAGLDYSGKLSSRLSVHGNAHYDSSIIGGFDAISPVLNPAEPQPPVVNGPDLALIGSRDRRRTWSFGGDASYSLSPRDSLSANAYYTHSSYSGIAAISHYDSYGGGLGYSRRISAALQLGLQGSIARYDYQGLQSNSQVYSLQATFSDHFSDRWTLQGAAGASFSNYATAGSRTNFTGNLQLCRQGPRASLCVTASDAVLPTGGTGTVSSKQVGASYSYKLTEHSQISASAEYSHNGEPLDSRLPSGFNVASHYVTLGASYDRTLSQRIHFVASTHYRQITGNSEQSRSDIGGSLGIAIRFGDFH